MSNFSYLEHYNAQIERMRRDLEEEQNPYHRQHIAEFSEMMDEKIRAQVPALIQQYNESQKVNVQAYINGEPATEASIVKGVRNLVMKAIKNMGKQR